MIRVSAKQILSISLRRLSSRIVYFGMYIGSKDSDYDINSGFLGNNTNSVPLKIKNNILRFHLNVNWICSIYRIFPKIVLSLNFKIEFTFSLYFNTLTNQLSYKGIY